MSLGVLQPSNMAAIMLFFSSFIASLLLFPVRLTAFCLPGSTASQRGTPFAGLEVESPFFLYLFLPRFQSCLSLDLKTILPS